MRARGEERGAGQSLLSLRWKPLTLPVLCPQEPDQVYEGITFDDFLKVRGRGEAWVWLWWDSRGSHLVRRGRTSVERSGLGVVFKTI